MDALAGYGSECETEDAVDRVEENDTNRNDATSREPYVESSVQSRISLLPSVDDLFAAPADSISKVRPARDAGIKYFSSSSENSGASRSANAAAKSIESVPIDRKAMDREAKEFIEKVRGSKAPPAPASSVKPPAPLGAKKQSAKDAGKDDLTAKVIPWASEAI
jgi:hypothetical protein